MENKGNLLGEKLSSMKLKTNKNSTWMDFLIPKNMTIFEGISLEHYFIKHKPFNF